MRHFQRQLFGALLILLAMSDIALAQRRGGGGRGGGGFRGGGGGGFRGGGGGGFRGGGGGFSRASARPSVTARPMPSFSPAVSRPNISPPSAASRPSISPPAVGNRPSLTPPTGANRPNITPPAGANRPNVNPPGNRTPIADRPRPSHPININDNDVIVGGGSRWDPDVGCCHPIARGAAWGAAAALTSAAIGSVYYSLPPDCLVTTVNGVTYEQCGDVWVQPQFQGDNTAYVVVSPPT